MDQRCDSLCDLQRLRAVSSILDNANDSPGAQVSFSASGTAAVCNDLNTSTTTDIELVGAVNFFDSTICDLAVKLTFSCR